ncbi:sigma-54-dependent Fis family transcriptional regulator [candidate division KSB1 bacterium]|nr:sigma-54-dependent Fis family transcriptional regulator [candidate division KSB1 bacterium]
MDDKTLLGPPKQALPPQRYGIIGKSPGIRQIIEIINQVAPTDISVLISGESGTGKELIAKAIHQQSLRRAKPLVTVNISAIPEGLLESELFGHERGAFTGADKVRQGYFELAHQGTVFLDEIGEMPLATQVKILRVLESGEFNRLGSSQPRHCDVRVIAATNKNLDRALERGEFREDLYYRLRAVTIQVPPLRERKGDVPGLVQVFVRDFCRVNNINQPAITPEGMRLLENHYWAGNVRELKNFVESLVILERGKILDEKNILKYLNQTRRGESHLPVHLDKTAEQAERELIYRTLLDLRREMADIKSLLLGRTWLPQDRKVEPGGLVEETGEIGEVTVEDMEKELIRRTLTEFGGNRRKTAKALGIGERTLYRKIKQYDL